MCLPGPKGLCCLVTQNLLNAWLFITMVLHLALLLTNWLKCNRLKCNRTEAMHLVPMGFTDLPIGPTTQKQHTVEWPHEGRAAEPVEISWHVRLECSFTKYRVYYEALSIGADSCVARKLGFGNQGKRMGLASFTVALNDPHPITFCFLPPQLWALEI